MSQNGEFSYLNWLIPAAWPRVLVDVGANDGITYSNSFNFIESGWAGLLIEPHPGNFSRLESRMGGRTGILLEQKAVAAASGMVDLFEDTAADGMNLMATIRTESNAWFDRKRSHFAVPVVADRLDVLLTKHAFDVDFSVLSTDTEGNDLEVLQSLGRFRPRIVVCERDMTVGERARERHAWLTGVGEYVAFSRLGCNEIWVASEFVGELGDR